MFNIYIKKAADIYGVPKTRQIYQKAIEVLNEENTREMCLRFAEVETKLGEVDRARAIYAYCSQICDPRITSNFWQVWKEFEVRHGNEDTMREMLRIKRSVQAMYNTQVNMMSAQLLNSSAVNQTDTPLDAMRLLDIKVSGKYFYITSFCLLNLKLKSHLISITLISENPPPSGPKELINFVRGVTEGGKTRDPQVSNPDEIDINMEDDDDDEADENGMETEGKNT